MRALARLSSACARDATAPGTDGRLGISANEILPWGVSANEILPWGISANDSLSCEISATSEPIAGIGSISGVSDWPFSARMALSRRRARSISCVGGNILDMGDRHWIWGIGRYGRYVLVDMGDMGDRYCPRLGAENLLYFSRSFSFEVQRDKSQYVCKLL